VITLCDVTRRYYLDDKTVIEPVKNVSLDIKQDEFVAIIGRSGSGKTTLLNLIAGLIKPSSGKIMIEGKELQKMNDRELSALRNRRMGFVFQFPSMLPSLKVMENVMLPRDFMNHSKKESISERASWLLEMVGLGGRLEAYPKQLSAGEQKRAVIARALINEPRILLADEPTSDLDERTEQEIMSLLMNIRSSGVTVIMVTHNLQLVPFASKAFKMENSTLREISTAGTPPEQIFESGGSPLYKTEVYPK
jgi:ABC-type lipoprotein export system ATPase subunit